MKLSNYIIYCFTIFLVGLTITLSGQTSFQWAKSAGSNIDERGTSIVVDSNGNSYSTGFFFGTVDFDPGPGTFTVSSNGIDDIFILKLDNAGNFVWVNTIGGTSVDEAYDIAIDPSGNIYITGRFLAIADFDPSPAVYNVDPGAGILPTFIAKYGPSGNLIWANNVAGQLGGQSITLDINGNVHVFGEGPTGDFDPGPGVFNLIGSAFVLKLTNAGSFIWAKQFTVDSQINCYGIAVDNLGNVILTGDYTGTPDFDPSAATYSFTSVGWSDAFLTKLDVNGNFVWAKTIGGIFHELSMGIIIDNGNNIYTTGSFHSTVDFDPNAGIFNMTAAGNLTDNFVWKVDPSGNFVWVKKIGGPDSDFAYGIAFDSFGNIVTTGTFASFADFDPGPGTFLLNSVPNTYDIYVSQLDASGNFLNAKAMGGTGYDYGFALATGGLSDVYTTGCFKQTCDFDPDLPVYNLTSNGNNEDIFVSKLNLCVINPTVISTNVLCNTVGTGSATINTVGIGPFSYSWSPVFGNTATITSLSPGTYSCIVSNACSQGTTLSIIIQPSLSILASSNYSSICYGNSATLVVTPIGGNGPFTYSWTPGPNTNMYIVTPTTNTTYTVQVSDNYSCAVSKTIEINIMPLPIISLNSGIICLGQSFTMNPTGASSYTFSSSSAIVSPTFNSSYTVAGTGTNGCVSGTPAICNVVVNPLPSIAISSSDTLLCIGQSATITSSGANSYSWNPSAVGSVIVISPTITSTYTVYGTDSNGCSNFTSITQSVSACTGFRNNFKKNEIGVFPNPANEVITIKANLGSRITVFDMHGKTVYLQTMNNVVEEINLSEWSNGLYLINIIDNDKSFLFKVIKE